MQNQRRRRLAIINFKKVSGLATPPSRSHQARKLSHPLGKLARGLDVDIKKLKISHKKLAAKFLANAPLTKTSPGSLLGRENILGVGIGEKLYQGKGTGRPSIRVYVRTKATSSIADKFEIPQEVNGVPTDVIEMLPFVASGEVSLPEHAQPGESIRHELGTFGTFGCLVATADRTLCVLGNQHVIGLENNAKVDDLIRYQPAIMAIDYPVARFVKGLQIAFDGSLNGCDAAIARTDPSLVLPSFPSGVQIDPEIVPPQINMPVHKFGRHGHTFGVITDIHAQQTVFFEGRPAAFGGQILVESADSNSFSVAGDSGALLLTVQGNHPVGLLFAAVGTFSLANPFGFVLQQLGSNGKPLDLVTQF